jgi:hypothetical protein
MASDVLHIVDVYYSRSSGERHVERKEKMGGVIIDGRAALRCEGTMADLRNVLVELESLQRQVKGFEVKNSVFPGMKATLVSLHFRGQQQEFEAVLRGLKKIRGSVAIDTVPVPDLPAIGTWPTPENGAAQFVWTVAMSV